MAANEVDAPELPFPPRERQSKPVHEPVDPTTGGLVKPWAGEGAGVMDCAAWVIEAKEDGVGVVAIFSPRLSDRQRRPLQGIVDVVAVLSITSAAKELARVDGTTVLPALNERQSRSVQGV